MVLLAGWPNRNNATVGPRRMTGAARQPAISGNTSLRSAAAFFEMIKDPEYQKAVVNRTAALADSRLVRFKPGAMGEGF